MVGTLQYMAAEVLKREVHSDKSDVYSFAVTINELATGVFPYSDRLTDAQAHTVLEMDYSEQQLASAISAEALRPVLVTSANPCTPPGLPELIDRCWQQDPAMRPSMDEIMEELHRISDECQVSPGDSSTDHAEAMVEGETAVVDSASAGLIDEFNWADQAHQWVREQGREQEGVVGEDYVISGEGPSAMEGVSGSYVPVLSYGVFATAGAREKMEDRHFLAANLGEMENVHAFGVFDGHRGFEAAEYAAAAVPMRLLANLRHKLSPEDALRSSFVSTDESLRTELDLQRLSRKGGAPTWHPGCTAATALIVNDRLYVANAGDCRTVVCRNGQAYPLSRDHTAADPDERERVQAAGGKVEWRVNTWRVGKAAIEVTRSLGDGDLKPSVTADPKIMEHVLTPDDEFMVMASDGLWEKMTNEEMITFVHDTVKEPTMCGKRLATEAVNRFSGDNITVLVVYLRPVSTVERVY
eukprot:TRINITY_DN328_c0_g1_i5.p1 TRINITY_DN328_c0_g1~~TRINITY_DN328_c0_g1_i5.p1  ORF type:complete len:470 (+),score=99.66 TRINITY_DN328_c0_g1_i5:507-1916(+)